SNCAPSFDAVLLRRATHPSTASSASATAESVTSVVTCAGSLKESATSAATPTARVARARVTQSAGPRRLVRYGRRPRASAAVMTAAHAIPTTQPAALSPIVAARAATIATWTTIPVARNVRTVCTAPPYSSLRGIRTGDTVPRFAPGWEGHE